VLRLAREGNERWSGGEEVVEGLGESQVWAAELKDQETERGTEMTNQPWEREKEGKAS